MSDFDLGRLHAALSRLPEGGRPALLPALHAAQSLYGYLPEPVVTEVEPVETAYPLSPSYAGASSSRTPYPGCQRSSCAGRCE